MNMIDVIKDYDNDDNGNNDPCNNRGDDIYIIRKKNAYAINQNNSYQIIIDFNDHKLWKFDLHIMITYQTSLD